MPQKGSRLTRDQIGVLRAWIDQGATWDPAVSFAKAPPRNLARREPALPAECRRGAASDRPPARSVSRGARARAGPLVDDRRFVRRVYARCHRRAADAGRGARVRHRPAAGQARAAGCTFAGRQPRLCGALAQFLERPAPQRLSAAPATSTAAASRSAPGFTRPSPTTCPTTASSRSWSAPAPATAGFTKGIVWRGVVNASQTPPMQAAQNISQVFMGVNLKCASCHDSFINDWQLRDAYGLAGDLCRRAAGDGRVRSADGQDGADEVPLSASSARSIASAPRAERLQQLAACPHRAEERPPGADDRQPAVGAVHGPRAGRAGRRHGAAGVASRLLDWLAEDLVAHGYDLKRTMTVILTSRRVSARSRGRRRSGQTPFVFRGPAIRRMTAEQFVDAISAVTGVWHEKPAGAVRLLAGQLACCAAGGPCARGAR